MSKLAFYPDQPIMSGPNRISRWDAKGTYICQQKVDGWRMIVQVVLDPDTGLKKLVILSKTGKDFTDAVLKDPCLRKELNRLAVLLPAETHLDGEWLSRRACSKKLDLDPKIFFFDILVWEGVPQTKVPYQERWDSLLNLLTSNGFDECALPSGVAEPGEFVEFYEKQKTIPWSEGIVCKHVDSLMVARTNRGAKNPQWYKVRYRGGVGGDLLMDEFYSS